MPLMMINADKNNKYISAVKELYHSSFPKIEQIPFRNILKLCEKDKAALLIFTDNHEFVDGQNQEQRMKRKLFYLNNGYTEAGLSVEDRGETYDMLISGGTIGKEEYRKLLIFMMGKFLFWFMEPKVVLNP
ncbi:hypothetical protein A3842_03435 [Paenibacillus sp. P3E]|uniref:hypothetical protein n=1 Tax=Paenibacillus sp. P3E TaxID=1349435 RepID=UPI00093C7DA2|nr:hypothetical protein [Paenibacillus sp. P3E]OKP90636.1 hypothetical protein A3842_03435 [Paenibacillus sp. P3E]